jgi:hypothetical protein
LELLLIYNHYPLPFPYFGCAQPIILFGEEVDDSAFSSASSSGS